jgi:hypothetical protein
MKNKIEFVDAQLMHKEHPTTFGCPSKEELDVLKVGDTVKICTGGERFWTTIEKIDGNKITATVVYDKSK